MVVKGQLACRGTASGLSSALPLLFTSSGPSDLVKGRRLGLKDSWRQRGWPLPQCQLAHTKIRSTPAQGVLADHAMATEQQSSDGVKQPHSFHCKPPLDAKRSLPLYVLRTKRVAG